MADHPPHLVSRQPITIIRNERNLPRFQPWTPPLVLPEDLGAVTPAPIHPAAPVRGNVCLGPYKVIPN